MAVQDMTDRDDLERDQQPDMSLRGFLRQKHQTIAETVTEPLTVRVKGWEGAFAIRYEYPQEGVAPILKAGMRVNDRNNPLGSFDAALDVILATYTEIVARRPEDEDWGRPLEPKSLRFGHDLGEILDVDVESVKGPARLLVRHLFSPRAASTGVFDGDLVITEHASEVLDWLRKSKDVADSEFVGE